MYGPHVAILLMCVCRNTRRVDFRGLTGSQRTPRVWGVTITVDVFDQHSIVDCNSVIKKHSFTRLDLLLPTVFSA